MQNAHYPVLAAQMGVPNVWVIDPRRKKAFIFRGALYEIKDQGLTTQDAEITLSLDEVFRGL